MKIIPKGKYAPKDWDKMTFEERVYHYESSKNGSRWANSAILSDHQPYSPEEVVVRARNGRTRAALHKKRVKKLMEMRGTKEQ